MADTTEANAEGPPPVEEIIAHRKDLKAVGFELDGYEDSDEIKVLRAKAVTHATIKVTKHLELRKTGKRYVAATLMGAGRPHSDEVRHWMLTLSKHGPNALGPGYDFDAPLESFKLEDEEIERLAAFVAKHVDAVDPGEYLVIPKGEATKSGVGTVVGALAAGEMKEDELKKILTALSGDEALRRAVAQATPDEVRRQLSAALTSGVRHEAISRLTSGMANAEGEAYFQKLLADNWWMFGGRYVSLVDRRDYTTDETYDIPLVAADGYVEIIELKRPSEQIFKKDGNRWVVAGPVNDAVNQVAHYISEAERVQDTLREKYGVDFFKARGKVVIGVLEPTDADHKEKKRALRAFNSHLHRIEVITYSELRERSRRLVALDEQTAGLARA